MSVSPSDSDAICFFTKSSPFEIEPKTCGGMRLGLGAPTTAMHFPTVTQDLGFGKRKIRSEKPDHITS
jgi:hypothetical protein